MARRVRGETCSRSGLARVCGGSSAGRMAGQLRMGAVRLGVESLSQPCQGATELGFSRPALWEIQGRGRRYFRDEPSHQGEEPSAEGS